LKRLGIDYIDLFLIHWPEVSSNCEDKWQTLNDTWRALEVLYDEGLCKAIGVSNYEIKDLEKLLETSSVTPHVNQIEFHPYQNPKDLRNYCEQNKIQIQGYCPLGKGQLVNEQKIIDIALRHERTPAQVLIRWSIQNGVPTIPKSTKEKRVKENIGVFDFALTEQEMNILNNLHDGRKFIDGSNIKDKIDSELPDGYKLGVIAEYNLNNHRRHS
jgi:diketogulonate reductase-like aldo/keto reductase